MKHVIAFALGLMLLSPMIAKAEVEKFDLNKATVEQLMAIPDAMISEDMAKAIIEQSQKAPYVHSEDLLKAKGVDNKMVEAINPLEEEGTLWYDPDNEDVTLAPSKC